MKNRTALVKAALGQREGEGNARIYFCQVRFLWRLARSCLRRLCLLIFAFRLFFSEPIYLVLVRLIYHFVKRILNDSLGAGGLQLRDQFPDNLLVNDCLDGDPARQAEV